MQPRAIKSLAVFASLALFTLGALTAPRLTAAQAADYPNRPIRIVAPFAPGGLIDRMARLVGERLQAKWGQPVIIENRAGSGGNVGAEMVFKSPPDGYTLLVSPPGPLVINKFLFTKLNFEPEQFTPVSMIQSNTGALLIHPSVGITTLKGLIDAARANPQRFSYSSGGSGSTSHLTMELLKTAAGVNLLHVPYKGNVPALTDLLGGVVQVTYAEFSSAVPHIKSGRAIALAIGADKRSPALPSVPTMSETVPGLISQSWAGIVAPPGTPPAIANKIAAAVADMLKEPDVLKRLADAGLDPVGNTPTEMAAWMKQEASRWGPVIRAAGVKAE